MNHHVLGKGSYGTVFTTDYKHAIKQTSFTDTTWIKEILITNHLKHENVIDFLGVSRVNGLNFLSDKNENNIHIKMKKYICLRDFKITKDDDIILIMRDIAGALVHCHDKKILHRDVKECNVLLEYSKGVLKRALLTDFGLSISNMMELNLSSNVVTSTHRPPEVIRNKTYDDRVDTWGFGMIVVFLITGKHFMQYTGYDNTNFLKFVLRRNLFLRMVWKFINENVHKGLQHNTFYFDIIDKCLQLHDSRSSMGKIFKYINAFISSQKIKLSNSTTSPKKSLYHTPILDIKNIIGGEFTPQLFDRLQWAMVEKKITCVNPLYPKLISLTRILTHSKEKQIFNISPSTTYSFISVYLILESVLLDTFSPIAILRKRFPKELAFNAHTVLGIIYKILNVFHFNMVGIIHYYMGELEKITKKSRRRMRGRILSFRLDIPWGC